MDWLSGVEIIAKGRELDRRAELWQLYCCTYPHMTEETFYSFEDLLEKQKPVQKKTEKEIMSNVEDIINMTL